MRWLSSCLALGLGACAGIPTDPALDPRAAVPPLAYRSILETHPALPDAAPADWAGTGHAPAASAPASHRH